MYIYISKEEELPSLLLAKILFTPVSSHLFQWVLIYIHPLAPLSRSKDFTQATAVVASSSISDGMDSIEVTKAFLLEIFLSQSRSLCLARGHSESIDTGFPFNVLYNLAARPYTPLLPYVLVGGTPAREPGTGWSSPPRTPPHSTWTE